MFFAYGLTICYYLLLICIVINNIDNYNSLMDVKRTIELFDAHLKDEGLEFEAVIIGGAALNVMAIIKRETMDVDCLDPAISKEIIASANRFRSNHPEFLLQENWLNNGPDSLIRDLDDGWRMRVVSIFKGEAISLKTLGRIDLLKTKLFAYCDRETDFQDCIALSPTKEELESCFQWVSERDANPHWINNVRTHFDKLENALLSKTKNKEEIEYE